MAERGLSPVSRTRIKARSPHRKTLWEFDGEWVDPHAKSAGLLGPRQNSPEDEFFG